MSMANTRLRRDAHERLGEREGGGEPGIRLEVTATAGTFSASS
jgi:hypothetical protein